MSEKYDDIINMVYCKSDRHPHMSMHNRAAQFSPFAALSGYDTSIKEAARATRRKMVLSEDECIMLNNKMSEIMQHNICNVYITYFEADKNKEGGEYKTIFAKIRRFDEYKRTLVLSNGKVVRIEDIYDINLVDCNEIE